MHKALPLREDYAHNLHLIGDQLANPVVSGGGSGVVHEASIRSPLDALCELYNITKFENTDTQTCSVKHCNL